MKNYLNNNFLKSKQNINMPIVKALLKYDQSNFSLLILEYVEPKFLTVRETFYITYHVLLLVSGVIISKFLSLYDFQLVEQNIYLSIIPVLTYFNADTEKISILKDNKGKSGVYKISSLALEQSHIKLNPYWVAGFIDAEGSFMVSILKNLELKTGWRVKATLSISLHENDRMVLELIQKFFGVGDITKQGKDSVQFRVTSLPDLINVIIPYFDKFSLITQKRGDFELFKMVIEMMSRKEHLTAEGLQAIINIRATLNRGLFTALKQAFPNTIPVLRPLVQYQTIRDPNWLAGFTSGEGCFLIDFSKAKTNMGKSVTLRFKLTQHSRDEELMKSIVEYLGCGSYYPSSTKDIGVFIVSKFTDNLNKIIPFFDENSIIGIKSLNFADFKRVAEIIKNKAHLTSEGLDQIEKIKAGINRGRK